MIVTITPNPLLDYVLHSTSIPDPGGKRVAEIPFTVGGKGINVARMLKTLGRPALALTFAGGANGNKIIEKLKQQGISFEIIKTETETRAGINLVVETPLYHTWWIENGNELKSSEIHAMIEKTGQLLENPGFLIMSGTIPGRLNNDFYQKLLLSLKAFKGEIFLDAREEPLKKALNVGGFFLKHNRDEARQTFGLDPYDRKQLAKLLDVFRQKRLLGAMFTDGKNEAILWDGYKIEMFYPAPAAEVSAVGCGDATLAGLIYARSLGKNLKEAAIWGLAAGAADCEMPGPCEASYEKTHEKLSQVKIINNHSFKNL